MKWEKKWFLQKNVKMEVMNELVKKAEWFCQWRKRESTRHEEGVRGDLYTNLLLLFYSVSYPLISNFKENCFSYYLLPPPKSKLKLKILWLKHFYIFIDNSWMFVCLLNTIFISSLDDIRPKNRLYLTLRLIVTYLAYFDLTQKINPNSFICFLEWWSSAICEEAYILYS